ncbi:MAG: UDP-N-acetylglucosamine--N-acetylmuramyl-(pentapeptide) pyrophosphoryl-undecaprenol N-acetylglucosamine transferase [Candidatus Paceibacterota bacterium]
MKIVFTGGGTGGHFYPIIAIAEAMTDLVRERRLIEPQLYFMGPDAYDKEALFENGIVFIRVPAGKWRRYFSLRNYSDLFVTLAGTLSALAMLFRLYPDVVVSKGGYGSIPTLMAARLLRIPVVIHESDSKPGRASLFAATFAAKIAISYESAAAFFPKKVQGNIARTGTPIRKALMRVEPEGAREYLKLEQGLPTVYITGGSQGSQKINETVITALPALVALANVIHQTGENNLKSCEAIAQVILDKDPHASRYHAFGYLSQISLQRAAGIADVIVSRAGTGTIAEISTWKKPAILIPIPESVSHDQHGNAYAYARTGAAVVIEEGNLTPHLLASEIERIIKDKEVATRMSASAAGFTDPDAARILAGTVLGIALSHEYE